MESKALLGILCRVVAFLALAFLAVHCSFYSSMRYGIEAYESPSGWAVTVESRDSWGASDNRVVLCRADRAVELIPWGRSVVNRAEWVSDYRVRIIGLTRDDIIDFPTSYEGVAIEYELGIYALLRTASSMLPALAAATPP